MLERIIMCVCFIICEIAFFVSGVGSCIHPIAGVVMLCLECTIGIYIVYKSYKKILNKYS